MFAKVHNYFFLVLILIVAKAPTSWGFSISRTASYVEAAQNQKIWNEIKWLKLGHYEKTITGYKSAFRGPLFLNEDGFNSPKDELLTSIQIFFSDSTELTTQFKRHPQCQLLARRNWLVKVLNIASEDILPCEERTSWKKLLGATEASVIFASADLGNPASSFGHTFLKLINPANAKNKDLIDYGVNYAANADASDGIFYAVRGLLGAYRGIYTMLPYHQKIREYINLEGRDIVEYKLNFSTTEVDELINHLLELENSTAPYYFLSDNCSYQLMMLFDVIRPELNLSQQFNFWVIPIDTIKKVVQSSGLILEKKHKKSLYTNYLEGYTKLNFLQKKALEITVDELKIPQDYDLTLQEKAEVYETGMRYFAVKAYRSGEDSDEKKYTLSKARAELGPITDEVKSKKEFSPEISHDSSAVYFGYGNKLSTDYAVFKFRIAFHDLEQTDAGTVPLSLNNAGVFEFRYYTDNKKLSLEKFTIINLINTTPITQLDKNISWKAKLEILDQFRPDIEYSAGMSFDLGWLEASRLSYLISGRYTKDVFGFDHYQAGPEILFILRPTEKIGVSFDLTYFAQYKYEPYLKFNTKLNYEITRNLDLQIQANDQKDYQLNILKNFIF